MLRREIRGLRRQHDATRQAREALVREDASRALANFALNDLRDIRDRAIVALAWCSALRRSNVAAMRVEDVRFRTDDIDGTRYLEIFVPRSKTDQEGIGRYVIVTELPGGDSLCAYRAVRAWLDASGVRDGALFRTFTLTPHAEHRKITDNALDGGDVARAVKRVVAAIGLDPAKFAAHSARRGFVTSADAAGVRRSLIREQGGWKDDRMISTYTRLENVRETRCARCSRPRAADARRHRAGSRQTSSTAGFSAGSGPTSSIDASSSSFSIASSEALPPRWLIRSRSTLRCYPKLPGKPGTVRRHASPALDRSARAGRDVRRRRTQRESERPAAGRSTSPERARRSATWRRTIRRRRSTCT